MKYIITEDKLENTISWYVNKTFEKLIFEVEYIYNGQFGVERPIFFIKKTPNSVPRAVFAYTIGNEDGKPINVLWVRNHDIFIKFTKLFGELWKNPFEKWFKEKFPDYEVDLFTYSI